MLNTQTKYNQGFFSLQTVAERKRTHFWVGTIKPKYIAVEENVHAKKKCSCQEICEVTTLKL